MKKSMILFIMMTMALSSCGSMFTENKGGAKADEAKQNQVADKLANNQPLPTDIEYSLERYNLVRRAYWVNGLKEKAMSVERPAQVPLGYCVLISMGNVMAQFCVDGKVTSLNSYLTAEYTNVEYGCGDGHGYYEKPTADVDGSYGDNDDGIFFFTPQWQYVEWSGDYIYTDEPFTISNTVLGVY